MAPIEAPADRQDAAEAVQATTADIDALATVLAEAFQDDALTRWITPDAERRSRQLPEFFRVFLEISLRYDGVLTTADRDAALLFLPPGAWEETERQGVQLAQRFAGILGDDVEAMATISGLQTVHHPSGRPHYYLSFAGVSPGNQRHGTMSALIGSLVARIDREQVAAYSEASSPGGLAVSRRHGFLPVGTRIDIPDGPSLQPMWREPR